MFPASHVRGRFAPSPTGPLHPGSLLAALGSWLFARRARGAWLVRVEDIDPPREQPGAIDHQLRTLAAFGFTPDEPVLYQSTRDAAYAQALEQLQQAGLAFACWCSRADLAPAGGVHHACVVTGPQAGRMPAVRLRVPRGSDVAFDDAIQGRVVQDVGAEIGDVVLRRADGLWAYQLAVVVDDAAQGITDIVRGADLLDSTPRQILLQRALGLPTPRYAHLPLVVDETGRKLSKSQAAMPIDASDPLPALRFAWASLGQPMDAIESCAAPKAFLAAALAAFDPERIPARSIALHNAGVTSAS